ncbi:N-acyl homoserine lactonase family protein [Nocardioides humi]|uniref:N-acyl homoserine lactonase family protein n=1 Tax=Nocardioides humi TaxID=449461 RepID=A0ABN2A814_9ACTN
MSAEIYAIRYSSREAQAHEHFYRAAPCHGDMPMAYYVWLVRTEQATVLLDTGFTAAKSEALGRPYHGAPLETAAELGAGRIDHLVLSHLHFDHTGHIGEVADATVHIQQREMQFWLGRHAGVGEYAALCDPDDLSALVHANVAGRLRWLDGDADLVPGVTLHLVGGHTPGSQVVRVETDRGPVVLAADASHFYANYENRAPYAIAHTLPLMYDAFERLAELAGPEGLVIPGHDPLVMERFPSAGPGLEGRAVRIA